MMINTLVNKVKSKDSDKSKAREAFANLVANLWNEERTSYEESYELEDADEIPMEQLEEHNYKDLRVMDLYFSPDDSDTDSDSKSKSKSEGNDKGKSKSEDDDDDDKSKPELYDISTPTPSTTEESLRKMTNVQLRKLLPGKKGISKFRKEQLVELVIASKSKTTDSD